MVGYGFRPQASGGGPLFDLKVGNRRSRDELPVRGFELETTFGYMWRSDSGLFFSLSTGFATSIQRDAALGVPTQSLLLEPQLGFAF